MDTKLRSSDSLEWDGDNYEARFTATIDSLSSSLLALKSEVLDQSDQLASTEHSLSQIKYYVDETDRILSSSDKAVRSEDTSSSASNELKETSAEISRMIQAQYGRLQANTLKRDASKQRFESLLEELRDRCDALASSFAKLQLKRKESDLTAWASFQWFSALLVPASVLLAVVAYKQRVLNQR